jgi:hypothetical protein
MQNTNNEVVVEINEPCCLLECAFRDGISEEVFEQMSKAFSMPGYTVKYGVNLALGGQDKSILKLYYNNAKEYKSVCTMLESVLHTLQYKHIGWERPIDGKTLKSQVLAEIC